MKKTLFLLLISYTANIHAQDTTSKIKQINSLVSAINYSKLFYIKHDSTVVDMPDLKLYIKTYVTTIMDGKDLKKFVNAGRSKTEEKGVQKTLITSTAFYYDAGQLVKVEEYMAPDSSQEFRFEWYYENQKLIHHTYTPSIDAKEKSAKLDDRGKTLIIMAEELRKQTESKVPKM